MHPSTSTLQYESHLLSSLTALEDVLAKQWQFVALLLTQVRVAFLKPLLMCRICSVHLWENFLLTNDHLAKILLLFCCAVLITNFATFIMHCPAEKKKSCALIGYHMLNIDGKFRLGTIFFRFIRACSLG